MKKIVLFWFLGMCTITLWGQEVEEVIKTYEERLTNDPLRISGGISATGNFYSVDGIPSRMDPFSWMIQANTLVDFLEVKIPFNLITTSNQTILSYNYEIPSYTFVGLSPTYKWATLHLGDRSLQFSPYSFYGHNFFGIGLELKPKKWYIGGFYGRLKRAEAEDLNARQNIDPTFKRMGWGGKVGYDSGKEKIELTLFRAEDDETSIPQPEASGNILPAENVIAGIKGEKLFFDKFLLSVDYARSTYTRDKTTTPIPENDRNFSNSMAGLLKPTTSTGSYNAVKTNLTVKTRIGQIGLSHEWIDPGYKTLGALFFNNDLENFTANGNLRLFKGKVTLAANLGLQRNNLSGLKVTQASRFIGALNASYRASQKLVLNGAYSNFRNANKLRFQNDPFNPLDSISLVLVNQNASISSIYTLGAAGNAQLTTMFSYQKANSIQNEQVIDGQATDYYLINGNYSWRDPDSKLTLLGNLLINVFQFNETEQVSLTPSAQISRPFFNERLLALTGLSYTSQSNPTGNAGQIWMWRTSFRFAVTNGHTLTLTSQVLDRTLERPQGTEAFTEFRGVLQYGWQFNVGRE